jgi:hypothetical protein
MKFHQNITPEDHARVLKAIKDIKKHGDEQHRETAEFLERCDALLFIGPATEVGGSGSVCIPDRGVTQRAIDEGNLTLEKAAGCIRMNLARETIDTGGQRGIEGTFVHEGKHLRDFALMIRTFSDGGDPFDPTVFHLEHSAHITSGFYLMRRGGEFTEEGLSLGLLEKNDGDISVSQRGILDRLKNNYGLSKETPGSRISQFCSPKLEARRKK